MNPLFDVETLKTKKGVYESFYFRGNHNDGNQAFWLKHNLIRFNDSETIRFDNIFITYDRSHDSSPIVLSQSRNLSQNEIEQLRSKGWSGISLQFENGGYVQIENTSLKGKIGHFEWDFALERSGSSYYHFDKEWFYKGFFPKKKILTCDSNIRFTDSKLGEFVGMNGHNWGSEHAYTYAYANSNQFVDESGQPVEAYFDGFSAKIKLGPIISPFLSSGALIYGGNKYVFNEVVTCFQHKVTQMDARHWRATFFGPKYRMELEIYGAPNSERRIPWVELIYDHPSRKLSKVENTKFAKGKISVFDSQSKVLELSSDYFELETLSELKK